MFCHRKFGAQKRRETRGAKDGSQSIFYFLQDIQQQEKQEDAQDQPVQPVEEIQKQPEIKLLQKQSNEKETPQITQQIQAPAFSQQAIINTNQYEQQQYNYPYQVQQPSINTNYYPGAQNSYQQSQGNQTNYDGSQNQQSGVYQQNLCPPPNPQATQLQFGQPSNIYPPPPPQSYPSYNPQYPPSQTYPYGNQLPYQPEQQQDYGQNTLLSTNYAQQPPILTNYVGEQKYHSSYTPQPPPAAQMSTSHSQPIQSNLVQSSYGSYHSYAQPQNIENTYVQPSVVQPQNIINSYIQPSLVQPQNIANTYVQPSVVQPQNIQNTYVSPSLVQPQNIINPPNQYQQQNQGTDSNYSGKSTNAESSSPTINQKSKKEISLVESQLITQECEDLKITEIKPSPETHKIVIIKEKEFVFPLIQYKEQDECRIQFTEAPGIIVCQQNVELPGFEYIDRQCPKHNTNGIEHVCLEEQCKQTNQFLLCSKCIKNHKSHNFIELQEIMYCVKSRQEQLNEKDELINKMQKQSAMSFKLVKSKVMSQLAEIEQKFNEGYEELKQQLLAQRDFYQSVMVNLLEGGLTKLKESVQKILAQEQSNLDTSSSNLELQGFIAKFDDASEKLHIYRNVALEKKDKEQVTINIEDTDIHINTNLIANYDDLDQQIKIQVVKKNLQSVLYKEFLWLKEKEAIKLQGNKTNLTVEGQQKIQIISYQPL